MNPANLTQPEHSQPFDVVVEAGRRPVQYWVDLWRFRELLFFLAWRDILVRYKQTAIGLLWALLRPLATALVFTLIFGRLARLPTEGVPYPVLVLAGMLPWQFFASSLQEASDSLIAHAQMISKVYFPRLIVPASTIAVNLVDFLVALPILAGVMLWYGQPSSWRLLALPAFAALAVATALGPSLWFAALSARYRDFRYVVPFVLQFGLYVSPVGFSTTVVPEGWRSLYALNPMVTVIEGFRWAILGRPVALGSADILLSLGVVAVLLVSGVYVFRRTERILADVI